MNGECSAERAGFWDTAVAGSSALQAALKRCLRSEAARLCGYTAIDILWDCEAFYDSLGLPEVCRMARQLQYPRLALALGMQAHAGIRLLSADGCFSEWQFLFDTSILAGCTQSTY